MAEENNLSALPIEILTSIATYLPTASCVTSLARTCRRLHAFVESEGFRVFVQTRFPSIEIGIPPPVPAAAAAAAGRGGGGHDWGDVAEVLTGQSKALDRKGFVARDMKNPYSLEMERQEGRGGGRGAVERPGGVGHQTMGFVPVIDSYETLDDRGRRWNDRKEVVAWGTGAGISMRILRPKVDDDWKDPPDYGFEDRNRLKERKKKNVVLLRGGFERSREAEWKTFTMAGYNDGVDDIASINLFRPHQKQDHAEERIIAGRARGHLECLVLEQNDSATLKQVATYHTGDSAGTHPIPVRSADLSSSRRPLLAAGVGKVGLNLYDANESKGVIMPADSIDMKVSGMRGRTWTTKFLSHDKLALGLGPADDPLHVYQVTPSGVTREPLRTFDNILTWGGCGSQVDKGSVHAECSVYAVAPLPASSIGGGAPGDLFLSGWFNSKIKLHDLRSPAPTVRTFINTMDFSPIYSLLPIGQERFLAGAGRDGLLKMFDLRLSSGRQYSYRALDPAGSNPNPSLIPESANTNLFLRVPQKPLSPIYALSRPSPSSSTIFAGLESTIVSLDLVTTEDIARRPHLQHEYYFARNTIPLAGYVEPGLSSQAARLMAQKDVRGFISMDHMKYPTADSDYSRMLRESKSTKDGIMEADHGKGSVEGWDCRWIPIEKDGGENARRGRTRRSSNAGKGTGRWRRHR